MPQNRKESLIFTVLMCAFMVFFMSVYNISIHDKFSLDTFKDAWLDFPITYIIAMIFDWFIVSNIAKKIAFSIISPDSKQIIKAIVISSCMVCGMVLCMSLFGAIKSIGFSSTLITIWIINIVNNFIIALPLQLLIAGPLVRFIFRTLFPEGTIIEIVNS
ncbi:MULTISPECIES: DUF2798 domain-containing protein [unclassified Clostridioides]|uniref:DUF2798 domain-containing protein n=1 Tax=unclassified Clostridioides TaxID=2635829 RepID=UPI001D116AB0|nr:DUF2798 domain-containing protein [Clostridioides sp. ES-S-0171-01]MCC0687376.1 DUF2798 domain-containing protein [Clostridioides sp. ES-S-0056-01]MCC0714377.1 DUF2798 domain-containing protein [Clostridioides sp. ES-S-0077-01]UDN56251.1 DUF2798 domain-containing protein [Clostridioides sp. ES-S-0054-01]